ncbi:MAG: 6-phosphofructokinase [Candidatus Bathyarchaeia archaeon]
MKRIGVVTAGGDAPGMNAAIRSIVRYAVYKQLEVIGFERGYEGIIEGQAKNMGSRSVSGIVNLGGTILKTSRCEKIKTPEGLEKATENMKKWDIDGLITIGGDGTFRGANELYRVSGIPIIGIPATIDNDVPGTETTIGFDTAVNTGLSAIDRIRDTSISLERIFVVEVMGRQRGFLALEVGLAGGAEIILIPEIKINLEKICERLKADRKKGKKSEIIVMAEGVGNSTEIVNYINKKTSYEVRLTSLGYIQRGGTPTAQSRILASEFGCHAVNLLLEGKKKRIVVVQKGRISDIDLDEVLQKTKEIDLKRLELAEIISY